MTRSICAMVPADGDGSRLSPRKGEHSKLAIFFGGRYGIVVIPRAAHSADISRYHG